ncbi:MAG: hypothetical protein FJ137_04545 [Deltaproteobacteria bacterium]|nr:hypothetical protein [Deltaproteobacteria bacterium]
MTEPLSPDDALVLAYVDGTLGEAARAAFAARLGAEPALRAEVEGLVALRALLADDARFGQDSGVDAPPAHLVDAIVRAEVAARPDAIRAAVLRAADDAAGRGGWRARLSSWLVGGSLVGAGALALLVVVQRAEAPSAAPQAVAGSAAPAVAGEAAPPTAVPMAPPPPAAAALPAALTKGAAVGEGATLSAGDARGLAAATSAAPRKPAAPGDAVASVPDAEREAARGGAAVGQELLFAEQKASADRRDDDHDSADEAAPRAPSLPAAPVAMAPGAPVPATAAPPPASAGPAPSIPRSREEFLERRAKAKEEPAPKAARATADDYARARAVQTANEIYAAAEHELALGRAGTALDLAQRAEAADGARALGPLPAALQVRAYGMLRRTADAARVASRLLQTAPAEPVVVEALLVGADAAVAVGDRGLARRLLTHALAPANRDAGRRTKAQARLTALSSAAGAAPTDAAAEAAKR